MIGAKATSDIDIAVRVGPSRFMRLIEKAFGKAKPGSAAYATKLRAMNTGKIQAGEAGLRGLRKELQGQLGIEVDVSVVLRNGPFDNGPFIPLAGGGG